MTAVGKVVIIGIIIGSIITNLAMTQNIFYVAKNIRILKEVIGNK